MRAAEVSDLKRLLSQVCKCPAMGSDFSIWCDVRALSLSLTPSSISSLSLHLHVTPAQAQQALERDKQQEADMESEELLLTRGPGARYIRLHN